MGLQFNQQTYPSAHQDGTAREAVSGGLFFWEWHNLPPWSTSSGFAHQTLVNKTHIGIGSGYQTTLGIHVRKDLGLAPGLPVEKLCLSE